MTQYVNAKIIFVTDLLVSLFASACAIVITYSRLGISPKANSTTIMLWLAGSLLFSSLAFLMTSSYKVIIRHSGLKELARFIVDGIIKVFLLMAAALLITEGDRSYLFLGTMDLIMTIILLMVMRIFLVVSYDYMREKTSESASKRKFLIYGTSEKSVSVITRLKNSNHFYIAGFLIVGKSVQHTLADKKVYYVKNQKQVAEFLKDELHIDGIMFASEDDIKAEKDRLVLWATNEHVKVKYLPAIGDVKDGDVNVIHPVRKIEIEDLLGRDEIKISLENIKKNFKDKTIMVTGAAGSIGSELCFQLASYGIKKLILFDNGETPMYTINEKMKEKFPQLDFETIIGDVRQPKRLDFVFRKWHPQVVFHAAAYKHVPLMEINPCEAVLVNVIGSKNVVDKCLEYGVEKMVMISTDKAVNPTNIMGCSKRLAEIYVQSTAAAIKNHEKEGMTQFVTTRFGNVLGSNGSVIPKFKEQISKGGPVTVTDPRITRYFMTIPEACRLVMEAATMNEDNKIFVFDMGEPVKIDKLARKMITLAGFEPDKDIQITYSGLRPGEKLYEEVLATTENTLPTNHSRIRIANTRSYGYQEALDASIELEQLARDVDIPSMVKKMKAIVPEFKSNNSPYEIYDKE